MPDQNANSDQLDEGLIRALKAADEAPPVISARVDRALMDMSTRALCVAPAELETARWLGIGRLGRAGCGTGGADDPSGSRTTGTVLYADVNGSGAVDIADVFALARVGRTGGHAGRSRCLRDAGGLAGWGRRPMRMTPWGVLPLLVAVGLFAVSAALGEAKARFMPVEVFLDSPEPVAAWQFELKDRNASMKVVGVENGDSDVFQPAPYYDRDAVTQG